MKTSTLKTGLVGILSVVLFLETAFSASAETTITLPVSSMAVMSNSKVLCFPMAERKQRETILVDQWIRQVRKSETPVRVSLGTGERNRLTLTVSGNLSTLPPKWRVFGNLSDYFRHSGVFVYVTENNRTVYSSSTKIGYGEPTRSFVVGPKKIRLAFFQAGKKKNVYVPYVAIESANGTGCLTGTLPAVAAGSPFYRTVFGHAIKIIVSNRRLSK